LGDPFGVNKKMEEIGINGESQGIIILYHIEKCYEIFYISIKLLEIFVRLEESEVLEFKLLKLKKVIERMKDEFKQELDYLKYYFHSIKD